MVPLFSLLCSTFELDPRGNSWNHLWKIFWNHRFLGVSEYCFWSRSKDVHRVWQMLETKWLEEVKHLLPGQQNKYKKGFYQLGHIFQYLGATLSRQESFKNGSIPVVCIDVYVNDRPRGTFVAKQIATIDCFESRLCHSNRAEKKLIELLHEGL